MSKAKVAVLHGGLLARKGEARPMSNFGQPTGVFAVPQAVHHDARPPQEQPEQPEHSAMPTSPARIDRHEPKVTEWHNDKACGGATCHDRAAPVLDLDALAARSKKSSTKERSEFHARLDAVSHKRLKIAAAQLDRSQQEIVATAIDAYLEYLEGEALNNCRCMQNARG